MARIRTVKPEFFRHEGLFELELESGLPIRVAFAGLWTAADRDGRFKWKPRQLKLDCLPFDDLDFSRVLDALTSRGFVVRYADSDGAEYGYIPSWSIHQVINNRESESVLPPPEKCSIKSTTSTREARVVDARTTPLEHAPVEGKGREGKGKEGDSTEPPSDSAPAVVSIPLVDKTEYGVVQAEIDEWSLAYPGVNVLQQVREMRAWCIANAANRKTRRGVVAFVVRWLSKEQDKSGYVRQGGFAQQSAEVRTTTVPSRPGRDPVLLQLEEDQAKVRPMPLEMRQALAGAVRRMTE